MDIGEKIKEIRLMKNITQDMLAKTAGITKASVSNYELGKRQPKLPIIMAIAKAFEISVDELTDDAENKNDTKTTGCRVENIRARRLRRINAEFDKLTDEGQINAIHKIEELTLIPKYQKENDAP